MHVPATLLLTGPLAGNLPLVQLSAEAHVAIQVFGRRVPSAPTAPVDDLSLQLATRVFQPREPAVFGPLATRVILTIVTKTDELMVTIPDTRITTASNVFAWPLNELDGLVIHANAKAGSVDWDILAIDPETNGMLKGKYTIAYTVSAPTFLTPDLLVTGP